MTIPASVARHCQETLQKMSRKTWMFQIPDAALKQQRMVLQGFNVQDLIFDEVQYYASDFLDVNMKKDRYFQQVDTRPWLRRAYEHIKEGANKLLTKAATEADRLRSDDVVVARGFGGPAPDGQVAALTQIMDMEDELNAKRKMGETGYTPSRHIDVLAAVIALARQYVAGPVTP